MKCPGSTSNSYPNPKFSFHILDLNCRFTQFLFHRPRPGGGRLTFLNVEDEPEVSLSSSSGACFSSAMRLASQMLKNIIIHKQKKQQKTRRFWSMPPNHPHNIGLASFHLPWTLIFSYRQADPGDVQISWHWLVMRVKSRCWTLLLETLPKDFAISFLSLSMVYHVNRNAGMWVPSPIFKARS